MPRADFPPAGTLVYVDRAFSVKGVGTVALGFVLSGKVSLHDELRPVPGSPGLRAEVRGIQINDVDFDSADRGIRVGLSLRGVEPKDLEKCHWLDDGSFKVADSLELQFNKSAYYKQDVHGRDLHLQVPGETLPARLTLTDGRLEAKLPVEIPAWQGMRVAVLDLNARALRIAGGAACKF
jgi:selenocysteine-specific translation elongation factor